MGDLGLIPELGRSPGEGDGYPLQYSGLENSMDCIVHGGHKELDMTDYKVFLSHTSPGSLSEFFFTFRELNCDQFPSPIPKSQEHWFISTDDNISQLITIEK